MSRLVSRKNYGKLEGTIKDISTSLFFNAPRLNMYYNDIVIEKEANGETIQTIVKKRKIESNDLKVGQFISFD